jgi:hypothetical protein
MKVVTEVFFNRKKKLQLFERGGFHFELSAELLPSSRLHFDGLLIHSAEHILQCYRINGHQISQAAYKFSSLIN